MKTFNIYENLQFRNDNPYAEPLIVDPDKRILRFALKQGQSVEEHHAPHSPVQIVILKGEGIFTDGDGTEHRQGAGNLLVYEAGENHSIRALDDDLIFLVILHGVPQEVKS